MSRFLYSSLMMAPVLVATTMSQADLVNRWSVGDGDSSAMIQFDFIEGETYVFDISFDEGSFTGQDALDLLVAETDGPFEFTYDVISYSFGDFLQSCFFGKHLCLGVTVDFFNQPMKPIGPGSLGLDLLVRIF